MRLPHESKKSALGSLTSVSFEALSPPTITCLALQVHLHDFAPMRSPTECVPNADEKNGAAVFLGTERRDRGDQRVKNVRQWTRGVVKKELLEAL